SARRRLPRVPVGAARGGRGLGSDLPRHREPRPAPADARGSADPAAHAAARGGQEGVGDAAAGGVAGRAAGRWLVNLVDRTGTAHKGSRGLFVPSMVVIHADAGKTEAGTISWILDPRSRVSYHYLVGRDGTVYR